MTTTHMFLLILSVEKTEVRWISDPIYFCLFVRLWTLNKCRVVITSVGKVSPSSPHWLPSVTGVVTPISSTLLTRP